MVNRLYQLVDLLVAALIAGTSTVLWGFVAPPAVAPPAALSGFVTATESRSRTRR